MFALRSQFSALSVRAAVTGNAASLLAKATGASRLQFSTATTESASASEDATAAFLDATAPTEFRTVKTMKKGVRASPRKLTYLAQQVRFRGVSRAREGCTSVLIVSLAL